MEDKPQAIRKSIRALVQQYWEVKHKRTAFEPDKDLVHYAGRVFDSDELINLVDASLDFFLTANRFAEEFEDRFAEFLDIEDAVLTNSGSSANLLAVSALTSPLMGDKRLKPGDEVITTAAGFPSTLAPILQNGLVPVFVDVDVGTYNALADRLREAVGPRTRALFMAHTLGNPFDLNCAEELVEAHDLWLIEDNCDALGSRYNDQLTGTFGHTATFSFYPAHHITMGEGGCVISDDEQIIRAVRSFRDWGRDCYCAGGESNTCGRRFSQQFGTLPVGFDHKYVYSHIGYNLKVTDMQAAVGCAQLDKLDAFIAARKRNFNLLAEILKPYEDRLILPHATPHSDPAWFGYIVSVREGANFTRNELVSCLEEHKIETRPLFAGNLLRHPAFLDIPKRVVGDLKNSDFITEHSFFMGVYPGITPAHLDHVKDTVDRFMKKH